MSNPRLTLILTCLALAQLGQLAADCDHDHQYSHGELCCDFCPPGHFVKKQCSKTHKTTCAPCSSGTYSQVTDNLDSCKKCTTCQQVTLRECSTTLDANCSCNEGFLCDSLKCGSCQEKEICPRGHELIKTGTYLYSFHCEPCSDGMYSDTDGGVCKPLTRCDQFGLKTLFPGNKTHKPACRMPGEPGHTMVFLGLILALCTFTSLAVLVKTCMSKQKKQMNSTGKACTSTAVDLPDETLPFQLSMEEKGDRPIQEIDGNASLTSLTYE
ncbi:tumor necrosis factor receptor superfamily member 3-like isoform X1 [Anguilla rostrata]|uniref:tumor necrosis factor receptor superfamily member 3-like isoform X1 n=1 Tax=Anguilla rostrata TaxID=7938 RepID=UPI0030D300CE